MTDNISSRDQTLMAEFPARNPNPVMALTQSGELLYANPATDALLERFGVGRDNLKVILPDDMRQRIADMRQAGISYIQWEHPSQGRVFSCTLVELEERGIYHLYLTDITERHDAESKVQERTRELEDARSKLLESERLAAIGEFASSIAHEIRSPLSTLMMALDYFNSLDDLPDAAKKRAALGSSEASRLKRLLDEILLYAKPYAIDVREIRVSHLVSSTLDTIHDMPVSQGKQIDLLGVPDGAYLCGDMDKLKQVFLNLLINAFEAIEPGERVVWEFESDEVCSYITSYVRNGGDPIPVDKLDQITQPFVTNKPNGTGLGLAIVKRIVEAHDGTLQIKSDAQLGTEVSVHFSCQCRI